MKTTSICAIAATPARAFRGAGLHEFGTWIGSRWDVAPPARRSAASMAFVRNRGPWQVSLRYATILSAPRITQTLQTRVGVTLRWHTSHIGGGRTPAVASRIVNLLSSLQNSQTSIHLQPTSRAGDRMAFRDVAGESRHTASELHSNLRQVMAGRTILTSALTRHTHQISLSVLPGADRLHGSSVTRALPIPGAGGTNHFLARPSAAISYTIAGIRELVARAFRVQHWNSSTFDFRSGSRDIAWRTSGAGIHTIFRSRAWTVFSDGARELAIRVNHEGRQSAGGERVSPVPSALRTRQTAPVSMSFVRHEDTSNTAITQTLTQIQQTLAANGKAREAAIPQVDIPYLTRQVYDQFERELRIERERRGL